MRGIIEDFIFNDILSIAMAILFGLPVLVLLFIGYKRLFDKCNEKGWQAFIPIYNTYILGEIAGVNIFFSLLANIFFITESLNIFKYELVFFLLSLIGKYVIHNKICKMFNKSNTYTILMTLFPLPMYCILGLSKDMPIKQSNIKDIPIEYNDKTEIIPLTHIKKEVIEPEEIKLEETNKELDKTDIFEIPIINVKFSEPKTEFTIKEEKTEIIDSIIQEREAKKPTAKKKTKTSINTKQKVKVKSKPTPKVEKERKPRPKKLPKNRKKNKNKRRK